MGSAVSIERELDVFKNKGMVEASQLPILLENRERLKQAVEAGDKAGNYDLLDLVLKDTGITDKAVRESLIQEYTKMKRYQPKPIDTTSVEVPEYLFALTEKLAENAHEEWAQQRMTKGWVYGPERNDNFKHHPCLVPYQDLTDEEREYDRLTSMQTLKLLLSLGYRILPPEQDVLDTARTEQSSV